MSADQAYVHKETQFLRASATEIQADQKRKVPYVLAQNRAKRNYPDLVERGKIAIIDKVSIFGCCSKTSSKKGNAVG